MILTEEAGPQALWSCFAQASVKTAPPLIQGPGDGGHVPAAASKSPHLLFLVSKGVGAWALQRRDDV